MLITLLTQSLAYSRSAINIRCWCSYYIRVIVTFILPVLMQYLACSNCSVNMYEWMDGFINAQTYLTSIIFPPAGCLKLHYQRE